MSTFLKNTGIYTIGKILPKSAQFLLIPIYTNYLTPYDYGIVQSMTVLSTILIILFTIAFDRSVPRLYHDYNTLKSKSKFLGTVTISLIIIATFMLVITLVSKPIVNMLFSSISFYPYFIYTILTVYFTTFGMIPKAFYQVEQKAGAFVIISIGEFVVDTSLTLYFIVGRGSGAEGMLFARLVKSIIFIPFFIVKIKEIISITFNKDIFIKILKFSLPLIPALLSAFILNLSDRIFIERYFSLSDVGLYSVSYKMAELLLVISTSLFSAYNPMFYKIANQENQEEARMKLYTYNKIISIVLLVIATGIALFSEVFIMLFNEKYRSAYTLVPIIILGIWIGQVGGLFNLSIYQMKKTKQIMYLILISAVLNIGLNFLLVPKWSTLGAAVATTITFSLFFLIKLVYIRYCYYIPFAWKEISFYFLIAIGLVSTTLVFDFSFSVNLLIKVFGYLFLIAIMFLNNSHKIIHLLKDRKS